jgi:hypothetical protein
MAFSPATACRSANVERASMFAYCQKRQLPAQRQFLQAIRSSLLTSLRLAKGSGVAHALRQWIGRLEEPSWI